MAILKNVSAYGDFVDKEETKLAIEDGFDFTLQLDEDEAVDFGMDISVGKNFSVIIRVLCTGYIADAVCSYDTDDPDVDIKYPVSEDHENAVTDIVRSMRLGEIATGVSRSDIELVLRDLSESQPKDDILVIYGENYDKYLEAYDGYVASVYRYGKRMIEKHVSMNDNTSERWVSCLNKMASHEFVREALAMSREYNTRDAYVLDPKEVLEEKLYAISEQGMQEGKEQVREMSESPDIPVLISPVDVETKPVPEKVIASVCERLTAAMKKSHK